MIELKVIGHLGKDAEVKQVGTNSVINFSVAHTEKYLDAKGNKQEKTTWVSCAKWGEKTTVAQYLKKGTQVYVSGAPEPRAYKNNAGEAVGEIVLRVFTLELLGGKAEGSGSGSGSTGGSGSSGKQTAPASDSPQAVDDDLPF